LLLHHAGHRLPRLRVDRSLVFHGRPFLRAMRRLGRTGRAVIRQRPQFQQNPSATAARTPPR
jgi:hypothetical protein